MNDEQTTGPSSQVMGKLIETTSALHHLTGDVAEIKSDMKELMASREADAAWKASIEGRLQINEAKVQAHLLQEDEQAKLSASHVWAMVLASVTGLMGICAALFIWAVQSALHALLSSARIMHP